MIKKEKHKGINIIRRGNFWVVMAGVEPEFILLSEAKDWIDLRIKDIYITDQN